MWRYTQCAVAWAICLASVTACSGIGKWFEEEDHRVEIIDGLPDRVDVETLWQRDIGSADDETARLHPLITRSVVYASDDEGSVYAYRAADGKRLWERDLDMPVSFALGGDGRLLVLGDVNGYVVALSGKDGKERWRTRLRARVTAISGRYRNTLVVRTGDDRITALNAGTGRRLWSVRMPSPQLTIRGVSIPLLYQGMAVVGLDDGHLALIDLDDGKVVNRIRVGSISKLDGAVESIVDIDGHIAISEGMLVAAAYQGPVIALDMEEAEVRWLEQTGSGSGPVIAQDRVYMVDSDGGVVAFNRISGRRSWRNSLLEVKNLTYPAVTRNYIVLGDDEGYIYWLSRRNGRILSRESTAWTATRVLSVRAISNNRVFVLSDDGSLALLQAPSRQRDRS